MTKRFLFGLATVMLLFGIAYMVGRAQSLKLDSVSNPTTVNGTGKLPWRTALVDTITAGATGRHISLAYYEPTGTPYISYYDAENKDLRLAHPVASGAGNCGPDNSWSCETIDSTGDVGQYSSVDVIQTTGVIDSYAKVGISYYDATNRALKYAVYTCAIMCSWTIYEVDSSSDAGDAVGQYSSLKFNSSGDINIAYHYFDDYDSTLNPTRYTVKYAYYQGGGAGNCGDGNDWNCSTVDSQFLVSTGTHISLDMTYGDAVRIAFYRGSTGDLLYAWYQGFGGSCSNTSWECVLVDDGNGDDVGKFVSLHAADSASDNMKLAYYDTTNGKIRYAVHVGTGGNCTSTAFDCFAVDTVGANLNQVGVSLSVDAEGSPIIAYMDAADDFAASKLNVARPSMVMGEMVGNCGEVPPGMLFMYWWCETIDPGYQDIVDEAYFTAVGVNPGGLAMVAYYEWDEYYLEGRLKIAYQMFEIFLPLITKP